MLALPEVKTEERIVELGSGQQLRTFAITDTHYEPFDVMGEGFLLGWAMREDRAIPYMQAHLTITDFAVPLHRRIAERVFSKYEAQRPITPHTIWAAMKNDAELIDAGGLEYLKQMMLFAPARYTQESTFESQVVDTSRHIADLSVRRRAEQALFDTIDLLRQGESVEEALLPVVEVADEEQNRLEQSTGSVQISEAAYSLMSDLEAHGDDHKIPAAPTGLMTLDEIVGGNFPGELVVVGGRPGMGKSIIGQAFAEAAALDDFAVDYFDLENRTGVLTARMLCDIDYDRALREGRPPIHYSRIRLKRLSADERTWLAEAALKLRELDIAVHDREELTMEKITSLVRAKRARTKKRMMVVIDHMHLVEPSGRYAGRKVDEVSEVTKGAKRVAKRHDASVILLAQLNRGVEGREDKRPTMADFRESGSIEQDADTMYGAHRLQYYLERNRPRADATEEIKQKHAMQMIASTNVLDLGLLKNRNGPTSDLQVFIDVASAAVRDEKPVSGPSLTGLFA